MADIAIAPLERNYFNRFKTQCKYLEYAINGIPGVYSKWFYTDVKGERRHFNTLESTGFKADTPQEWIEALSFLIENDRIRRQIGENARKEAIEQYDFSKHASRWQGFVEMIGYESDKPKSS